MGLVFRIVSSAKYLLLLEKNRKGLYRQVLAYCLKAMNSGNVAIAS
jgi:hypothetical protein